MQNPQGVSSPAVNWWLQGLDRYRLKDADEIGRIDLVGHGVQFTIVSDIAKAEPGETIPLRRLVIFIVSAQPLGQVILGGTTDIGYGSAIPYPTLLFLPSPSGRGAERGKKFQPGHSLIHRFVPASYRRFAMPIMSAPWAMRSRQDTGMPLIP